ncbi:MAG: hypothetical protein KDE04_13990, partial [Anaerolineales bacterium]|nr:hypothetical protein [Anaerolineales bacterium]
FTALLLLTIYLARTGRSPLLSTLALPLALAWSGGWLACYLEGCAYGAPTTLSPLAADLPDSFGVFALRYQTQLLGLAGALLTLTLLYLWQRRAGRQPRQFWLTLALLSAQQLLLLPWRGDPAPILLGWRLDGWAWLLFILWALTRILSETRSLRTAASLNGLQRERVSRLTSATPATTIQLPHQRRERDPGALNARHAQLRPQRPGLGQRRVWVSANIPQSSTLPLALNCATIAPNFSRPPRAQDPTSWRLRSALLP